MPTTSPVKEVTPLTALRITYTTSTPFNDVEARLRSSIVRPPISSDSFLSALDASESQPNSDKSAFESIVTPVLGTHGFMNMQEQINHGAWMHHYSAANAFGPDGRILQSKRWTFGNPFVAITMLKHDLNAGLFAPVELIMIENPDGGCRVVYLLPSSVIAGYEGATEELKKAANGLDQKLEALVRDICA